MPKQPQSADDAAHTFTLRMALWIPGPDSRSGFTASERSHRHFTPVPTPMQLFPSVEYLAAWPSSAVADSSLIMAPNAPTQGVNLLELPPEAFADVIAQALRATDAEFLQSTPIQVRELHVDAAVETFDTRGNELARHDDSARRVLVEPGVAGEAEFVRLAIGLSDLSVSFAEQSNEISVAQHKVESLVWPRRQGVNESRQRRDLVATASDTPANAETTNGLPIRPASSEQAVLRLKPLGLITPVSSHSDASSSSTRSNLQHPQDSPVPGTSVTSTVAPVPPRHSAIVPRENATADFKSPPSTAAMPRHEAPADPLVKGQTPVPFRVNRTVAEVHATRSHLSKTTFQDSQPQARNDESVLQPSALRHGASRQDASRQDALQHDTLPPRLTQPRPQFAESRSAESWSGNGHGTRVTPEKVKVTAVEPSVSPDSLGVQATEFSASHLTENAVKAAKITATQIAQAIVLEARTDRTQPTRLEVELDPPELGKIQVELSESKDGIVARVIATRESTALLVENQLATIRAALDEAGVQVSDFQVGRDDAPHDQGEGFDRPKRHRLNDEYQPDETHDLRQQDQNGSDVDGGGGRTPHIDVRV